MKTAGRQLLLLLLLSLFGGCISVGYLRFQADEPVAAGTYAELQPGTADLAACLRELGAPHRVFEYRGDGMALLWSWLDTDDWSFEVQVPMTDQASVSFEFDSTDFRREGCLLWFGPDLVLERKRWGTIGELLPGRSRPVAVE